MSVDTTISEIFEFHQFVGQKIAEKQQLTPEELVDLWREEHPSPEDTEATVAAVKKSLDGIAAGDKLTPIEEFQARFRAEHNIP